MPDRCAAALHAPCAVSTDMPVVTSNLLRPTHTFTNSCWLLLLLLLLLCHQVIMACGHKVVEVDISSQPNAPYIVYLRNHMSGRCHVYGTCMNLYDPKLPPLESPADLRQEHVDWCENFSMEWMKQHKFDIRQIGWLEGPLGAAAGTVHGL